MKSLVTILSLVFVTSSVFAAETSPIHNVSHFEINWSKEVKAMSDGLGCPEVPNVVTIKVPGILNRDFSVQTPGGNCKMESSVYGVEKSGDDASTLTFEGTDCASENDVNFVVRSNTDAKKKVEITVDAGC